MFVERARFLLRNYEYIQKRNFLHVSDNDPPAAQKKNIIFLQNIRIIIRINICSTAKLLHVQKPTSLSGLPSDQKRIQDGGQLATSIKKLKLKTKALY